MLPKPHALPEPDKRKALELERRAPSSLNVFPAPSNDKAKCCATCKENISLAHLHFHAAGEKGEFRVRESSGDSTEPTRFCIKNAQKTWQRVLPVEPAGKAEAKWSIGEPLLKYSDPPDLSITLCSRLNVFLQPSRKTRVLFFEDKQKVFGLGHARHSMKIK